MKTLLLAIESWERANFHRGIVNGFLSQKDLNVIVLYCPRDVKFSHNVYDELILHVINKCNVDIFFAIQGEHINVSTIRKLNQKRIKTVVWQVDDPYSLLYAKNAREHKIKLREYQYIYTTNRESILKHYPVIDTVLKIKKVKFLPFGYDPEFHQNLKSEKTYDISFVGSAFPKRIEYILPLAKEIELFGSSHNAWNNKGRISHKMMIEVVNSSKINLNFSDQPINGVRCLKNRVMEILGAGQFLLSEDFPEAKELFEIDKELVVFNSLSELEEKIDYYLFHDKEREKIARAGYKKVKENYSYRKLLSGVLEDLK